MFQLTDRIAERLSPWRFAAVAAADREQTMAATCYQHHGGPEVLQYDAQHPRPIRTAGQTLVRVQAAGVNPVDYKMRQHQLPQLVFPLPKIPGTDIAGEVVETDADSGFDVGDRVFGMMPLLGTPWGACAEYAAVAHRFFAKAPPSIEFVGAASLPLVALTVIQGLSRAIGREPTEGKRILIQAGSGGVGTFAIQYCSHVLGMRVATTCNAGNVELVRSLGAEVVIDYRQEKFEEQIRDYDFVFDPLGHRYAERTLRSGVLRRGGHYVHIAGSDWPPESAGRFIREASPLNLLSAFSRQWCRNGAMRVGIGKAYYHLIFVHPCGTTLQRVADYVDRRMIAPVLDRTFPLEQTAAAHEYLEQGHTRGKVVIEMER